MKSIAVIGNVNVDILVSPVVTLPQPGGDQSVERLEIRPGGAAGNTALALSALGRPPDLVGNVGDDLFGRFLREQLAAAGITAGVTVVPDVPTGVSIALEAPQRDRSFLTLLGSLEVFGEEAIPPAALTRDLVLLCGYFCLPRLRGQPTHRLLERIRSAGGRSFFDCGWDPRNWPPPHVAR